MQENVQCVTNSAPLQLQIKHANGNIYNIAVGARRALIDPQGVIRFFSVDYDDGDTQAYKLHPRHSKTAERFGWVLDFLAGYGLSRLGGKLVKPRPGLPTHQAEAIATSLG
ncbi:MAG: hypothetical protein JOZ90_11005 [Alphaproteobacteria bacterium]|nr:hypothetical protein [Alphaproteobacteria bacterium]MBV9371013.1 hypothetical protein [Alphaproteobacteria bacterium]MBV9901614.1 hypothetical protein [Alphaproteobacteria bacterium]